MRTWHIEAAVVAIILGFVFSLSGHQPIELVGSLAILATFMHCQVSFRLQEAEERRKQAEVYCYRWLTRYFLIKEALWLIYFVWHGAWSALVGVFVFLLYPLWRGWYMKSKSNSDSK